MLRDAHLRGGHRALALRADLVELDEPRPGSGDDRLLPGDGDLTPRQVPPEPEVTTRLYEKVVDFFQRSL